MLCLVVFLFMFMVLELLGSLSLELSNLEKFQPLCVFNYFSCPHFFLFSYGDSNCIYIVQLEVVIVPQFTDVVSIFVFIFSPFFALFCIFSISTSSRLSTLFVCNV